MKHKKITANSLDSGMEMIRGGLEVSSGTRTADRRCVCSPGGWSYGNLLGGCACGCFTASPQNNQTANHDLANPIQ